MNLTEIILLAGGAAALLMSGWGSGFWMGTYFVSRSMHTALEKRVSVLEKNGK